jgi:hypothetical protein
VLCASVVRARSALLASTRGQPHGAVDHCGGDHSWAFSGMLGYVYVTGPPVGTPVYAFPDEVRLEVANDPDADRERRRSVATVPHRLLDWIRCLRSAPEHSLEVVVAVNLLVCLMSHVRRKPKSRGLNAQEDRYRRPG